MKMHRIKKKIHKKYKILKISVETYTKNCIHTVKVIKKTIISFIDKNT